MWPWMNQGFSPMYGMGGGFGGYPQYQPQAPQQSQGDARIDKLKNRVGNLQEQWKGAGTEDQAGIQARIDQMQGRIKGLRQDRRQGEGQFAQPEPAQAQGGNQNGMAQYFGQLPPGFGQGMGGGYGVGGMGMGGGMPQFGGMNFGGMQGGYNPNSMMTTGAYHMSPQEAAQQQARFQELGGQAGMNAAMAQRRARRMGGAQPEAAGAPTPVAPQQQAQGWNPAMQPTGMGNMFDTGWGRLVASSTGNQNVMQLENDPSKLFHYDPNAVGKDGAGARGGWKSMTPEEYQSYGDYNYYDPRQAGAAANPMMQGWERRNGMWQGKVGTGAYA